MTEQEQIELIKQTTAAANEAAQAVQKLLDVGIQAGKANELIKLGLITAWIPNEKQQQELVVPMVEAATKFRAVVSQLRGF